jgi:hypothetical protein
LTSGYAGTYSGAFQTSTGQIGTVSIAISTLGALTGSEVVSSTGASTTLTGTVTSAGAATVTIGTDSTTGAFSLISNSTPTASLTLTDSSGNVTYFVLIVNPATITGGSIYEGDYAGSIFNFSNNSSGVLAINIGTDGTLTGTILTDDSGTPSIDSLTGTVTANVTSGTIGWTVATSGTTIETATGTVTLSGTTLLGSLTTSTGSILDFAAPLITPSTTSASSRRIPAIQEAKPGAVP